ncbi:DUF418 domain-containing protein [Pseudoduganella sp. OTU4001]|uniref:DUF418 domain-containing protein n=1 Tax=Pseudoduganella sp. OTU4001 TaxID=3043854 RepID=UPI00313DE0B3
MIQSRLQNVDALRGFALLGILAVNVWAFADPYYRSGTENTHYASLLDQLVRFAVGLLFEGKFYLLFSLLFGYSFSLQLDAAQRADTSFKARMLRRGLGLFGLGVLHGCLLFDGDILNSYGLLSIVLLAWHHLPPRRAIKRAIWLVVVSALLFAALGAIAFFIDDDRAAKAAELGAKLTAFHGSAAAAQAYFMGQFPLNLANLPFMGASSLAMFVLGYSAGRERLLARVEEFRRLLPRVLWIGLPLGLAGAFGEAFANTFYPSMASGLLGVADNMVTGPFLTASYVALMLMLFDTAAGARVLAVLAPMGRLALSNYLMQSAILAVLFTGYGFRLCDRVPPLGVVGIVCAIFFGQMALSAWWIRRHTYGPAEWLLRAITNWSFRPSRQRATIGS